MKTMSTQTVLVIAEKKVQEGRRVEDTQWQDFALNVPPKLRSLSKNERLAENVWQLPLESGLPLLCDFLEWGKNYGIPIRLLFLEGVPTWQRYLPE